MPICDVGTVGRELAYYAIVPAPKLLNFEMILFHSSSNCNSVAWTFFSLRIVVHQNGGLTKEQKSYWGRNPNNRNRQKELLWWVNLQHKGLVQSGTRGQKFPRENRLRGNAAGGISATFPHLSALGDFSVPETILEPGEPTEPKIDWESVLRSLHFDGDETQELTDLHMCVLLDLYISI